MANLKLKNPSGGSLNFVNADGASDLTVTFPAVTGTAMVSGNMPAFSAYQSSSQTIPSGTSTKVLFQTEEYDTNNNFASSTFTPTVAGYYQFNACAYGVGAATLSQIYFYKNGTLNKSGGYWSTNGTSLSSVIYCNGTTDYIECWIFLSVGQNLNNVDYSTWFNGCLVRAA